MACTGPFRRRTPARAADLAGADAGHAGLSRTSGEFLSPGWQREIVPALTVLPRPMGVRAQSCLRSDCALPFALPWPRAGNDDLPQLDCRRMGFGPRSLALGSLPSHRSRSALTLL